MIRINRLTDYAVIVLAGMVRANGLCAASQIAADTGVPLPTVAKLLKALVHNNLVTSQRGVAGGYSLKRPAGEISIADVIEAMEGPITITPCIEDSNDLCRTENVCPLYGHWSQINQAIRHALRKISLIEIAATPRPESVIPDSTDDTALDGRTIAVAPSSKKISRVLPAT